MCHAKFVKRTSAPIRGDVMKHETETLHDCSGIRRDNGGGEGTV